MYLQEEDNKETADSESDHEDNINYSTLPSTEIIITVPTLNGEKLFRALLDSGTSRSLISEDARERAQLNEQPSKHSHAYQTTVGTFNTSSHTTIRRHKVVELSSRRQLLTMKLQVYKGRLGSYDMILGRDYMKRYGIDLHFSDDTIRWENKVMPMHPPGFYTKERLEDLFLYIENPELESLLEGEYIGHNDQFTQTILDSKYEKQDLTEVTNKQRHLTPDQRQRLYKLLQTYEKLFDGTLGQWTGQEIDVELRPEIPPFHCKRAMRIPQIHLEALKRETDRLCAIGVLEKTDGNSPWCAPSFCIPKKDGRIRVITDFRELNKAIIRHPWPMPHIADMIENIGKYTYATCLDLAMGYYHLLLSQRTSNLTTFMLPFGCYRYKRLPMGLNISPDVFQRLMIGLFSDLPFVNCYIDDIAIISNGSYQDHLDKVSIVLDRLLHSGLQVNALKSFWATTGPVEYLGFILTPQGIKPQPKKIQAIKDLKAPSNRKQLRRIVGIINYYRYMWRRRSHLLAPLTSLLSTKTKFVWTNECQEAFETLKATISEEVMLTFPDYTRPFHLYTDASDYQIGAVLTQQDRPIAFFSRKLNQAQRNYGVGEKEMLSIVETLKEFRTIIYGYPVIIHTDHKNLVYDKTFQTQRIMRWRLAIEEYMPTLQWVPGVKNPVADMLSRHPTEKQEDNFDNTTLDFRHINLAREYTVPVNLKEIYTLQLQDPVIKRIQREAPERLGKVFDNTGERTGPDYAFTLLDPISKQERILVPEPIRKRLIHWYHHMLLHPGEERLYVTLHQHYYWPNMRKEIKEFVKTCDNCQKGKRGIRGYGHVPLKDIETQPWKDMCCDLAGPWTTTVDGKPISFHSLTMIDPFTSWVEIHPIYTKESRYIRDLIKQQWLRRYPRPSRIIFDQGGEFDNAWFFSLCKRWNIKPEPITVKNPRANAVVERLHRTMADMLRCNLSKQHKNDDPINDMLSAVAYGVRATVHGTTQYTPGQLVFSKDMILRTHIAANMEMVRIRRRKAAEKNNIRENRRRIKYDYKPGDQVLILTQHLDPKLKLNEGPYTILDYNRANGTLQIRRGNYIEPINIRLVRPYFGRHSGGD